MTEIQRNSREFFATQATQAQKDAIKNLKDAYEKNKLLGTFEQKLFLGTKEDVEERYKDLEKDTSIRGIIQPFIIDKAGGVDNLFDILDADGNGEVTQDEISDAAVMHSYRSKSGYIDTELTAEDLKTIYENAMAAEGASVEVNGNKQSITYKNGDVTGIEYADDGHIVSQVVETNEGYGQRSRIDTNYDTQTTTSSVRDSQGRIIYESIDAPGRIDDQVTTTEYDDKNGTKVVRALTIGKITTTEFDKDGKVKDTQVEVMYESDGRIDATKQQSVGECWLLSGVNALASTEKGRKILEQAIQHNDDGSVTVHLKGVGQSYTYSAEEIVEYKYDKNNPRKRLSRGDTDMKLLEMAIADYKLGILPEEKALWQKFPLLRNSQATKEDPLNGGNVDEMMEYLTGENAGMAISLFSGFQVRKKQKDSERYAMTAAFLYSDKNFKGGDIVPNHVYSVSKVTKDTVYLVNPWDSSKEIAYPKSRFYTHVAVTSELDLNKVKLDEEPKK